MKLNQLKEEVFHAPWVQTAKWMSRKQYESLSPKHQGFVQQYIDILNSIYNDIYDRLEGWMEEDGFVDGWDTHEQVAETGGWDDLPIKGYRDDQRKHAFEVDEEFVDPIIAFMDKAIYDIEWD